MYYLSRIKMLASYFLIQNNIRVALFSTRVVFYCTEQYFVVFYRVVFCIICIIRCSIL